MANIVDSISALTHLARGIGYLFSGSNENNESANANVPSEAQQATAAGQRPGACCNGERETKRAPKQRSHRVLPFVPGKRR